MRIRKEPCAEKKYDMCRKFRKVSLAVAHEMKASVLRYTSEIAAKEAEITAATETREANRQMNVCKSP